jgi:hypothetical protein
MSFEEEDEEERRGGADGGSVKGLVLRAAGTDWSSVDADMNADAGGREDESVGQVTFGLAEV